MQSIKSLYKIGHGPSSSHTMGPSSAAKYFKRLHPLADHFEVTLYGSLALTGRGHLTDQAIIHTMAPINTTINWNITDVSIEHANTMDFVALRNKDIIGKARIFSIGGGAIKIKGEAEKNVHFANVYKENKSEEILKLCKAQKLSLVDYIKKNERDVFWKHLNKVWHVMQQSIKSGLKTTGVLPGKLKLQRRAKALFEISIKKMNDRHIDGNRNKLMSYAFAVAEHNASGGIVVTAPTCGASGILPAVLRYAQEQLGISDNKIINALSIAGLIGNIARTNGSIAGAEAGCQAEVGVACAMAAGAYTYLLKLSNTQIFNSAADVLEHHLGLTCDPVLGYVQSPCIERNALASLRALDAVDLISLSSNKKTIFNYDDIIETMLETGKNMSKDYRETSQGGLASIYAKKIDNKFKEKFDIKIS